MAKRWIGRVAGILLAALGVVIVVWGVRCAVRGVWPYLIGEPFDLIVSGAVLVLAGFVVFDRGAVLRWWLLFRGLPETEMLPDKNAAVTDSASDAPPSQADSLAAAAREVQASSRSPWSLAVVLLVTLAALAVYLGLRHGFSLVMPPLFAKLAAWIIIAAAIFGYLGRSYRKAAPLALRKQLLQQGVPVCLACGYNLKGITAPRCPECGELIEAQTP